MKKILLKENLLILASDLENTKQNKEIYLMLPADYEWGCPISYFLIWYIPIPF